MLTSQTYKIEGSKLEAQSSKSESIPASLLSAFSFQLLAAVSNDPAASNGDYGNSGQPSNRPLRIVIAGGGTGGHLFPGIAIAQEFKTRNSANKIIFVSTGNPMEKSVLSKTDFELQCITAAGIKGRGIWNQLISVLQIPKGIWESIRLLKNFSPNLAIGLGSYSAGPVLIGAWLLRIPIAVQEQNILPGITNRILSRFANRIYISFENTKAGLDPRKVRWTGNPIRRELLEFEDGQAGDTGHHKVNRRFTILIIGGSQGAHRINMAVIEALEYLKDKGRLHFVHQTGEPDEQPVRAAYRRHDIQFTVQSFFDDMAQLYRRADLLICRAGATTVAEISALGKAVIFIPFPYAADNHQVLNAGSLSNEGAAEMIIEKDLSGKILSEKIEYYAAHPAALKDMAVRARRFGNPAAAKNIVDDCYQLIIDQKENRG
jgi:UDP-N-acetylglucosamine--N-acetylmuramyl-(pentapeptide) pyrophosphoryl-undecaprenol N-acetylglucosamine transferase